MIYLWLFWTLILIFLIVYILGRFFNWKSVILAIEEKYGILFFLFLFSLAIIAIVTKDPVEFAGISIPAEMQWLGSLLLSGFGAWKFYLNPLKQKVYFMDRELGEIKSNSSSIDREMKEMKDNFYSLREDVHLIKREILKR